MVSGSFTPAWTSTATPRPTADEGDEKARREEAEKSAGGERKDVTVDADNGVVDLHSGATTDQTQSIGKIREAEQTSQPAIPTLSPKKIINSIIGIAGGRRGGGGGNF